MSAYRERSHLEVHSSGQTNRLDASALGLCGTGYPVPRDARHYDLSLGPGSNCRSQLRPIALAQEWDLRSEDREVASRAELARQLGVSRAHVTQILSLLSLAPKIQDIILALGDPIYYGQGWGIRTLRSLGRLPTELQSLRLEECLLGRLE